ncbi:unnamed protein product [Caenorhabditis sp. 36 PRJEB53466]|nr:unnamed protein product [Caenorhabditis sp. 36 PRJEB53466]
MKVFIFVLLLVIEVAGKMSKKAADCFKDYVLKNDGSAENLLLFITSGFNIALLFLNITILFGVLRFIRPAIAELRKQTFIIMDALLLSCIPESVREVLGCPQDAANGGARQKNAESTDAKSRASGVATTGTASTMSTGGG